MPSSSRISAICLFALIGAPLAAQDPGGEATNADAYEGTVFDGDFITIGAGAKLAAKSGVMTDVPSGVTWGGVPARDIRDAKREFIAMQRAARGRGKRRE